MGVRYNTPLTKVVVVGGFFWLFILFGLSMSDYLTRRGSGCRDGRRPESSYRGLDLARLSGTSI